MYRVRLNFDVLHWAYYRRCAAIQKYAPPDFHVDMGAWHVGPARETWPATTRYDLVLQLVPDHDRLRAFLDEQGRHDTIIVGGLNVGYGHHKERFRMCKTGAGHIVSNNRDCWERMGRPEGMTWISNGVDLDLFNVVVPISERKQHVLWTGCNFHCHRTKIKGWDAILMPLGERMQAAGMKFDYRRVHSEIPKVCFTTEQMIDWYQTGTIYICTSSSEGTPNPALEAAACGCVVVSTRVGNMPELIETHVNGELVDRDVDSVYKAIVRCQSKYLEMATAMQERIAGWDWKYRAEQYYDLFRRLIDQRRKATSCAVAG
jgi:glycosyltransferase involved in cell wall biosynthesis